MSDDGTRDLLATARRMLGDLEQARTALFPEPDALAELGFGPAGGPEPAAIIGARAGLGADDPTVQAGLEAGAGVVEELVGPGVGATLTEEQEQGLDMLLHFTARPALDLGDESFEEPLAPWSDVLRAAAGPIAETGRSVGRIDKGRPPHAGTGFLVADGVLMTNCHVARAIADPDAGWALRPDVTPTVSFAPDPGVDGAPAGVAVEAVIGVHDRLDLALLRIAGDGLPEALELTSAPTDPLDGHSVYVVGYPARNHRQPDLQIAQLVFRDRYGIKRLQPGAVLPEAIGPPLSEQPCSHRTTDADVLHHDASTLGGNSGSCIVDLATHRVVGLHFAGAHRRYNDAVALWKLAGDPLLRDAGVPFRQG